MLCNSPAICSPKFSRWEINSGILPPERTESMYLPICTDFPCPLPAFRATILLSVRMMLSGK
jgi:hypothetical protein